ncbi:MAG: hypothetical protein ABJE47_08585 [bacterium]
MVTRVDAPATAEMKRIHAVVPPSTRQLARSRALRRCVTALLLGLAPSLSAQERGAEQLHLLVRGLTVTPRVLILGTLPEDADADLIAWLARGHLVETGYLSVSRGEARENYVGRETGVTLSALRTGEALAARRIDGGRQYFTRAFDIGYARTADAVFKLWNRDTLLSQLVVVIRAVRPHVLINSFSASLKDGDGQHDALTLLASEAFTAAGDSVKFPAAQFGAPWSPLKLYENGPGLVIDANEYAPVLGRTYNDIATESRAQQRTHGMSDASLRSSGLVQLHRVATQVNADTPAASEKSLFDGIDTSFARIEAGFPRDVNHTLRLVATYADSARRALDLEQPARVVRYLSRAADAAASVRINMPWCRHSAQDAQVHLGVAGRCTPQSLDLDASIDLVQHRVNEALFNAAGISVESSSDRELIGSGDSALVTVTVRNHGTIPVTLREVTITGAVTPIGAPVIAIPPDSTVRLSRKVAGLVDPHPWYIGQRAGNFYYPAENGLNGLAMTTRLTGAWSMLGMTQPEDIHRTSDVTVLVDIGGAFVSMSAGPVLYRVATPQFGARAYPLAEVPPVTLAFERALEWVVARKSVTREFRVTLKSWSDSAQQFTPKAILPASLHLDSLPSTITLAPHEQRLFFLHARGSLEPARHEFGFFGLSRTRVPFTEGFRTIEYPYLPPIRPFRTSAMYLRAVEIEVPRSLSVAYVQGIGDDVAAALKQIGAIAVVIDPDDLLRLDLSSFSAVVIGPRAFEAHEGLFGKIGLLHDFARKGGTVLLMAESPAVMDSRLLPFPVSYATPIPYRVTSPDAPVVVADHKSRLLNWPNVISADDWMDWSGDRAVMVPSAADSHYARPIEMHDPEQAENRNAILATALGKGWFIYTTLTLPQQIALGVPGSMRLLVNMLSIGLAPDGRSTPMSH